VLGGAGGAEAAAPKTMPLRFNAAIEWYSSRNPDIPVDEIRTALTTVRQVLGGAIPAPPSAAGIAGACQAATYVPLAAIEARFQADADLAAVCRPLGLTGEDQRLRKLLADLAEQRGLIDVRPQQHTGGGAVADPLAVELRWVQDWEPPVLDESACVEALREFFLLAWTAARAENPALKGGFMFLIQLGTHLQQFGLRDGLDLAALARVFKVRARLKTVLYAISAKHPQLLQVRQALVPGTQHEDTEARWTGVGNQGWN
jgi:hypothetical protein